MIKREGIHKKRRHKQREDIYERGIYIIRKIYQIAITWRREKRYTERRYKWSGNIYGKKTYIVKKHTIEREHTMEKKHIWRQIIERGHISSKNTYEDGI